MGYVLRDGKRYYEDASGRVSLDNVSQEEADRRERRNNSTYIGSNTFSGTPRYSYASSSGRVPWTGIFLLVMAFAMLCAALNNRSHISSAERTIAEYMENESMENEMDNDEDYYNGYESESVYEDSEAVEAEQVFLLPDSADRYLDASELASSSSDEIQLMINEIYARHGREFQSRSNKDYFSQFDWYSPVPGKTDDEIVREFNEYEIANVSLLAELL